MLVVGPAAWYERVQWGPNVVLAWELPDADAPATSL